MTTPPRPAYVVLFDGSTPALGASNNGLDLRIAEALPLLGAFLDFPRNVFEASERGSLILFEEHLSECPYSILLMPWPWEQDFLEYLKKHYMSVTCTSVASVQDAAIQACSENGFNYVPPGHLPSAASRAWRHMADVAVSQGANIVAPPPRGRTVDVDPQLWGLYLTTSRVLRLFDVQRANADFVEKMGAIPLDLEEAQNLTITAHARAQFQYDWVNSCDTDRQPTQEEADRGVKDAVQSLRSPLVLGTLPPSESADDYKKDDDLALHFLVAHRALALGGIGFTLDYPRSVWQNTQVLHSKLVHGSPLSSRKPSGRLIQQWVGALGAELLSSGGQALRDQLTHASWRGHVAVHTFSDLPMEWLSMPDMTDPLCMVRPVVRRPVHPITAALQSELTSPNVTDLRLGLRVVCFECMSRGDVVYKAASRIGESLAQGLREFPGISVQRIAVTTKKQLLTSMFEHREATAFVIVAHGVADPKGLGTAILVGERDLVMPGEFPVLPPLVIFSSCNTSIRGGGWQNIADSALVRSATAVISAAVPIEAMRSQYLLVRFFRVLAAAIQGDAPHDTVLDVWHHVQATHVVHDIIDSWPKLRSRGAYIADEFKHKWSKGRLRTGHMIEDTISVLVEMSQSMRFDGLRERLKSEGFFPESLFYSIAGWPDKIWANDPIVPRHKRRSRR